MACDLLGLMPNACEPRVLWTSAVAIEALLRCGLTSGPRVVGAINTFLSAGGPGWCGNCIFMAKQDFSGPSGPIDFGRFEPSREQLLEWPTEREAVMEKVADDPDTDTITTSNGPLVETSRCYCGSPTSTSGAEAARSSCTVPSRGTQTTPAPAWR